MPFNRSQLHVSPTQAWRWTTLPDANGNGGVKSTRATVPILVSQEAITLFKQTLSQAQKDELQTWATQLFVTHANPLLMLSTWHLPGWSGEPHAWYLEVPVAVWPWANAVANPDNPPTKVKQYLAAMFREAS